MTAYVVQSAQGTAVTATGTVTLPAATRAGNTIAALASVRNSGTSSATLTNVTLAGAQDNFGHVADFGPTTGLPGGHLYWWIDPLCAGGQTQVVFTTTGGAGTEALTMDVLELGGLLPLAASASLDRSSSGTAATATWNSGTTGTTNWPTEIFLGGVVAGGTSTVTGPGYPWIDLTAQPNGTISITQFGYLSAPSVTAQSFAGSFAASQSYVAGVVSIPCMTTSPALPAYIAGQGLQQGDAFTTTTSPLLFVQERVVFRAAQVHSNTTLPSGDPGATTTVQFDTVYEDPWQGWNTSSFSWLAPFTGWYHISMFLSSSAAASGVVSIWIQAPGAADSNASPTSQVACVAANVGNTALSGSAYMFLVGGQDSVTGQAYVNSASSWTTSSGTLGPSTMEIVWVASAA